MIEGTSEENLAIDSSTYSNSDGPDVFVLDRFLQDVDFAAIWTHFSEASFLKVHSDGFERVFRLYDGEPLMGEYSRLLRADRLQSANGAVDAAPLEAQFPADDPLSPLAKQLVSDPRVCRFLTPLEKWERLSLQLYIYPPGTGLAWHHDRSAIAAFIYYAHPAWRPNWGGELLVADSSREPPDSSGGLAVEIAAPSDTYRGFYPAVDEASLTRSGLGRFISPLPNRLVLIRGGVAHTIKKVEAAAGEAFRASVSGFFGLEDP